jgi:hypothetical protein
MGVCGSRPKLFSPAGDLLGTKKLPADTGISPQLRDPVRPKAACRRGAKKDPCPEFRTRVRCASDREFYELAIHCLLCWNDLSIRCTGFGANRLP